MPTLICIIFVTPFGMDTPQLFCRCAELTVYLNMCVLRVHLSRQKISKKLNSKMEADFIDFN